MSDRNRVRRPRGHRVLVLAAAAVFVFLPVVAGLLGLRAKPLENRPLADRPSLAAGWDVFDEASAYVRDHLPVRNAAVEAHGKAVRSLFREPPTVASTVVDGVAYPKVVLGHDGWLFYGGDFQNPCTPVAGVTQSVDRLERVATLLRKAGKDVAVVVVPDKSTIVADQLPDRYIGRQCAAQRKSAFWSAYTRVGGDLLDLRQPLSRASGQAGGAYLRSDSHWTPRGGLAYAQALTGHLDHGVWQPEDLREGGTFRKAGDLGAFILEERVDAVPDVKVQRQGVRAVSQDRQGRYTFHYRNEAGDDQALVRGRTVLVGDSFTFNSRDQWSPWFEDITTYHRSSSTGAEILDAVVDADTVVLEVVERDASSGRLGRFSEKFVNALEKRLAG